MQHDCKSCLYFEYCNEGNELNNECEYYCDIDELSDDDIEYMVESGREKFLEEWLIYASEYSDHNF